MPYTEEYVNHEELRKALILAGIREIEKSGINGLSLRKVATQCGVSCAAPYRHFESKASFVFAIIAYVNEQWTLLKERVAASFKDDKRKMITEICIATVLFWRANPNFKSVIMLDDGVLNGEQKKEKNRIADEIAQMTAETCEEDKVEKTVFLVRAILYGAAADTSVSTALIKSCIESILPEEGSSL